MHPRALSGDAAQTVPVSVLMIDDDMALTELVGEDLARY